MTTNWSIMAARAQMEQVKLEVNSGSSMNKRKDNSSRPILGQYYLDRHSILNTNILKITGLVKYYALINRARGPYEEILVLTFKAYGPNAERSMRLECQNKYFPYGPKSRLIRALLYTYPNKTV